MHAHSSLAVEPQQHVLGLTPQGDVDLLHFVFETALDQRIIRDVIRRRTEGQQPYLLRVFLFFL
jgi:hypothetical protein